MLYVDPGAGTLLWQFVLSFFLGGVFFACSIVKRFFNRLLLESSATQLAVRKDEVHR